MWELKQHGSPSDRTQTDNDDALRCAITQLTAYECSLQTPKCSELTSHWPGMQ